MDERSIDTTVNFADAANGDLHLTGASDGDPDLAGTPLTDVTDDIDGDIRSTVAPTKWPMKRPPCWLLHERRHCEHG
ncbi:MAG: hypothetical protein PVH30_05865 [Desulfobacterales bacterium]|jgi:hypothetical protein